MTPDPQTADLATRYTQALIAKLEQATDPMMVAVLTHKIEQRMNAPAARQDRTTGPPPTPNALAGDAGQPARNGAAAPARLTIPKRPANRAPHGAVKAWLLGKLARGPARPAALADLARADQIWHDNPTTAQLSKRVEMTLRRGLGQVFAPAGDGSWTLTAEGRRQAQALPAGKPDAPETPAAPPAAGDLRGFLRRELRRNPGQSVTELAAAAIDAAAWGGERPTRATASARVFQALVRNPDAFSGETRGGRARYWRSL